MSDIELILRFQEKSNTARPGRLLIIVAAAVATSSCICKKKSVRWLVSLEYREHIHLRVKDGKSAEKDPHANTMMTYKRLKPDKQNTINSFFFSFLQVKLFCQPGWFVT